MKLKSILLSLALLCALTSTAIAQDKRKLTFDYSDGVLIVGSGLDLASSINQREGNPLARSSDGRLSMGKGLALKGGLFGAFKALDYVYTKPSERKILKIAKICVGVGFGVIALRNKMVR